VSGLLGGRPVIGVIVRSSTNVATDVHQGICGTARRVVAAARRTVEQVPMAGLAGLLVYVGTKLVKSTTFAQPGASPSCSCP
jgi:carbonic anhydrase